MKEIKVEQIAEKSKLFGRTYLDKESNVLYFNWTCGGFEVVFTGTSLEAEFCAFPDTRTEYMPSLMPGKMNSKEVVDWPWLAVILDGEEEPYQKILLDQCKKKIVLYFSEEVEQHRIRIVKLNENLKTQIGIKALYLEGDLKEIEPNLNQKRIEFIGDSITCGFGNGATDSNRGFYTSDENGWLTHGAIAARELGMEASFVCISGIVVAKQEIAIVPYAMEEIYQYTDRVIQDKLGQNESYDEWDFKNNKSDIIVLNLGTNDSTGVMFSSNPQKVEATFEDNYYKFIKQIRSLNGANTKLICSLGCMDYFLYDNIQKAVNRLKEESNDQNIYCIKYTKMLFVGDDVGACLHPSISKQKKMAEELISFIKSLDK